MPRAAPPGARPTERTQMYVKEAERPATKPGDAYRPAHLSLRLATPFGYNPVYSSVRGGAQPAPAQHVSTPDDSTRLLPPPCSLRIGIPGGPFELVWLPKLLHQIGRASCRERV